MKHIIKNRLFIYRAIRKLLDKSKRLIIISGLLKVLLILFTIASPYLFKILVDDVMISKRLDLLKWVCLGYIAIFSFESIVLIFQRITHNKLINPLIFKIRYKILNKYVKMPIRQYEEYKSGDLKVRIDNDVNEFEKFILQHIIEYFYSWALLFVTIIILLFLNWKLALFGFSMIPVSFWVTKWLGKRAQQTQESYRKTYGDYEEWLRESIQGWREIKSLCSQRNQHYIFVKYWHILCIQFFKRQMLWYGNRSFIAIKDFFITKMNLFFIGGLLIFHNELTIGALLVFMKYYEYLFNSLGTINDLDMQLSTEFPNMNKAIEILDYKVPAYSQKRRKQLYGNIVFQNIDFRYNSAQNKVLNNISFEINKGNKLAIVGRSGSGKTTLLKLLLRLYEAENGNIFIDNQSIDTLHPKNLYNNIGIVMQDSILFNSTIRENLLIAKPEATDKELIKICQMVNLDSFIKNLPEEYDTLIGEKGLSLSGGQRQLLSIARVLLKKPNIIVFDEATSSLDYRSEQLLYKTLEKTLKDKTILIISHKLSAILYADAVIIIDNGKIKGYGSHEELLENNKYYQSLFLSQYSL